MDREVYAVVLVDGIGKQERRMKKIADLHEGQPVPSLQPLYNEYCKTGKALSADDAAGLLMLYAIEDTPDGNSLADWVKWSNETIA